MMTTPSAASPFFNCYELVGGKEWGARVTNTYLILVRFDK